MDYPFLFIRATSCVITMPIVCILGQGGCALMCLDSERTQWRHQSAGPG